MGKQDPRKVKCVDGCECWVDQHGTVHGDVRTGNPRLRRSACAEHHVRELAPCRLIGQMISVFPWSKKQIAAREYGALLNSIVSRMIAEREAQAMTIQVAGAEPEGGDIALMVEGVKRAWREAEQWEKQLRSVRPPPALKRFHGAFLKGIRAFILGHGALAILAARSARWWYGLAVELLTEASAEMRLIKARDGALYLSLELTVEAEWLLVED